MNNLQRGRAQMKLNQCDIYPRNGSFCVCHYVDHACSAAMNQLVPVAELHVKRGIEVRKITLFSQVTLL